VSYGCTFRAERPTKIAVIMVGYADGFRRAPNNYGEVLIRGKRAPIAGRVCMDQTMIDVTDLDDVAIGDEVVLIGRQGEAEISAEEVAAKLGTNNYETVATINPRVERRYIS
jgi:alanine racemase